MIKRFGVSVNDSQTQQDEKNEDLIAKIKEKIRAWSNVLNKNRNKAFKYSRQMLKKDVSLLDIFIKHYHINHCTKIKPSIKDFFCKCEQVRRKLQICSHLVKKSLMRNLTSCPVSIVTPRL